LNPALLRAGLGVLLAIASTAALDVAHLSNLSALPLFALMALFWVWEGQSRTSMGFVSGTPRDYALAVLWPLAVVGALIVTAFATHAVNVTRTSWDKSLTNLLLTAVVTTLLVIVTEEGFFRGWLWASLDRARLRPTTVLVVTSLAFALWHVSTVLLDSGFNPRPGQVPVYLAVCVVAGITLGLLRALSGSVIVSSVGHGLWNGAAYVLFGAGSKVGALGVVNLALFGPESGILGLVANGIFAAGLWIYWRKTGRDSKIRGQYF
jgi:membrane protease YdiL (CAAX protease family)